MMLRKSNPICCLLWWVFGVAVTASLVVLGGRVAMALLFAGAMCALCVALVLNLSYQRRRSIDGRACWPTVSWSETPEWARRHHLTYLMLGGAFLAIMVGQLIGVLLVSLFAAPL